MPRSLPLRALLALCVASATLAIDSPPAGADQAEVTREDPETEASASECDASAGGDVEELLSLIHI